MQTVPNRVTVEEATSGTAQAAFVVTLSRVNTDVVRVNYQTADGTANAPGDYVAVSPPQTPELAGNETQKKIPITVNAHIVDEQGETFVVDLLNPANAVIEDAQGKGTITAPGDGGGGGDNCPSGHICPPITK